MAIEYEDDEEHKDVLYTNLPLDWTEQDFRDVFGHHGPIKELIMLPQQSEAARAFVSYYKSTVAQRSVSEFTGVDLEGCKCRAEICRIHPSDFLAISRDRSRSADRRRDAKEAVVPRKPAHPAADRERVVARDRNRDRDRDRDRDRERGADRVRPSERERDRSRVVGPAGPVQRRAAAQPQADYDANTNLYKPAPAPAPSRYDYPSARSLPSAGGPAKPGRTGGIYTTPGRQQQLLQQNQRQKQNNVLHERLHDAPRPAKGAAGRAAGKGRAAGALPLRAARTAGAAAGKKEGAPVAPVPMRELRRPPNAHDDRPRAESHRVAPYPAAEPRSPAAQAARAASGASFRARGRGAGVQSARGRGGGGGGGDAAGGKLVFNLNFDDHDLPGPAAPRGRGGGRGAALAFVRGSRGRGSSAPPSFTLDGQTGKVFTKASAPNVKQAPIVHEVLARR
ncbi:hypothetical protein DIPPA_20255 [Diplonema papillatum]|nr:hypothetical protein DIPPA_20255 [Diplonema papillatum]